jgi:hypothetical protein
MCAFAFCCLPSAVCLHQRMPHNPEPFYRQQLFPVQLEANGRMRVGVLDSRMKPRSWPDPGTVRKWELNWTTTAWAAPARRLGTWVRSVLPPADKRFVG